MKLLAGVFDKSVPVGGFSINDTGVEPVDTLVNPVIGSSSVVSQSTDIPLSLVKVVSV